MLPVFFLVVVGGQFYAPLGYISIGMMVYMLGQAIFKGRHYCGWVCAMGAFHDRVLARFSRNRSLPQGAKAPWVRWLVFSLMMGLMLSRLIMSGGDPVAVAGVFVMMWTLSTFLAVALGLFFRARSWCTICPMAQVQGYLGKNVNVLRVAESCKECGLCGKVCPVGINPAHFKAAGQVPGSDCLRCGNCVANCPVGALSLQTVGVPFPSLSSDHKTVCAD